MQRILGKWRQYTVKTVRGIDDAWAIDESKRLILIRRSWRPWRMLAALIEAMNDVTGRDDVWAKRVSGKAMFMCIDCVMIAGEEWKVLGCTLIVENPGTLLPYEIDHDAREVRINAQFNAAFSGPSIVQAVSDLWLHKVLESVEAFEGRMEGGLSR